ncbi:DUF6903 family protein [Paenibacillus donghaensis]|uniref:DUF6903 family protein n=1 Tax=Paenibacillus donghaensis TaxID=414771 RepID=UPI00147141D1|nr:hypothetical protein [Paenibacillus donghaensis]
MRVGLRIIMMLSCVGLVVFGHREVGYGSLGLMFVGLIGLLGLLYDYNRKYQ